jgi:hypothetical protein
MKRKILKRKKKNSSVFSNARSKLKDQLQNEKSYLVKCPYCQEIITLSGKVDTPIVMDCPVCNKTFATKEVKQKRTRQLNNKNIKTFLSDHFVELLLIIIGLIFLIQPTMYNIKISFTLILISTILLFLMTGDQQDTISEKLPSTAKPYFKRRLHTPTILKKIHTFGNKLKEIPLSNRISIVLILWTLLLFVITSDLEIYFILIFIGILITRELTDMYTTKTYKKRLNAYIIIFLFTYIILISQKIMEILAT